MLLLIFLSARVHNQICSLETGLQWDHAEAGPSELLWITLCFGQSIIQPTLSTAVGDYAHETQRGAAMGLLMSNMALGGAIAPFSELIRLLFSFDSMGSYLVY